ncbi:hypothetical protein RhiXN_10120 [Rhizoctonia solani]|uniref:SHSP domain-containing protein n=1 Tax=Rhizoctonia solani TaxID=456999 RepID=A0A8H8P4J6_9AGAM|nr:uncharacterized protein RhiXN_10120 [Rhizoctonia solani]QRW23796.1 hypothetical protein RhiXN_10120 [Rhizoctonia solani]
MSFSAPMSPPTNLSPMDITPSGGSDSDMYTNHSTDPSPDSMQSDAPTASTSTSLSSQQATNIPSNSVSFPKTASLTTQVVPPTPPVPPTTKLSRPQLTSRLSSRSGGKRHASIGSAREVPFHLPHDTPSTGSTATLHSQASSIDTATPGWNARLRDMGLHIPGMGSPTHPSRTPKSPRSGSMSSGGATPKSPDEPRAASYFSFRKRRSSGGASPGKVRTPPVSAPPPPPSLPSAADDFKRKEKDRDTMPSPIAEESSSSPGTSSKRTRANLSLDLSSTLASRGSTASLPLIGHTPVEHLLQQDDTQSKPRRASMMAPPAPPPHVHTPPVHPPSYEYPFLPHHAPRQPLEVRVEENAPGPGMEGGSWVISVRLPGFAPDGITVGTRRGRVLMIVADNYNDDDGGHFERRISFGYDADMAAIRAEFNGDLLRVTVPRRWIFGPMGTVGRSTTIGHGPGPGTGTRPTVEQPSNKPLVDTSASRSAESTRLPGMS